MVRCLLCGRRLKRVTTGNGWAHADDGPHMGDGNVQMSRPHPAIPHRGAT